MELELELGLVLFLWEVVRGLRRRCRSEDRHGYRDGGGEDDQDERHHFCCRICTGVRIGAGDRGGKEGKV